MSTRAVYIFHDRDTEIAVYKHHDGYPSGACEAIRNALPHAWPLPRFEADEFAAAFVAGNKPSGAQRAAVIREQAATIEDPKVKAMRLEDAAEYLPGGRYAGYAGGGVRLMASSDKANFPGDIEYCYRIGADGRGHLVIEGFAVKWNRDDVATHKRIFKGSLNDMAAKFRD